MALRACRECGHQVSSEAPTCPQCGAKDPVGTAAAVRNARAAGCLTVIGVIVILSVVGQLVKTDDKTTTPDDRQASDAVPAPKPDCSSDWKMCSDNADLVDHWYGWTEIQRECKEEAEKEAKYGTPEWPRFAFDEFRLGYLDKGIAIAIEDDAKFSNGFGAMAKVNVICTYDLNNNTVTGINIIEH
jgi:hypothetical protein